MARPGRPKAELMLTDERAGESCGGARRAKTAQALALRAGSCWPARTGAANTEVAATVGGDTGDGDQVAWPVRRTGWTGWSTSRGPAGRRRSCWTRSRTSWSPRWSRPRATPRTGRGPRWPRAAGCRKSTIGRIWRQFELKPHVRTSSSCPPTRSSWTRSSTWSGSTTTRRRGRWCCAWTRSPGSRPWTGPSRCCR